MGALDFLASISNRGAAPKKVQAAELPAKINTLISVEYLPTSTRTKAIERLNFIKLAESLKAQHRISSERAVQYIILHHYSEFPALLVGGKNGASQLTYDNLRSWQGRLKKRKSGVGELDALTDGYVRGSQTERRDKEAGDDEFYEVFRSFYLTPNKLSITASYDLAVKKIQSEHKDFVVPTLNQARYRIGQISPEDIIKGRYGETAWKNTCADYIDRDWSGIPSGHTVVGDSRTFDTRVRVMKDGKWVAVRPTVVALIDARSWYYAGCFLTIDAPTTETIIQTLAAYCRNTDNRLPAAAYFDRGKDYCGHGFSKPITIEGFEHSVFKELGIELVNALAFNARAKPVERAFRDTMANFDKLFPDYLGSNPGQRTDAADYFDSHPEELPTLEQFAEIYNKFIDQYHRTPKHGKIHQGHSPLEIWSQRPDRQQVEPGLLQLGLLKPEASRVVGRGPAIAFNNKRYHSDAVRFGQKVLVKTDVFDASHVMLFALDGALIGPAYTKAAIKAIALHDPATRAQIGEGMRNQRRQLNECRARIDSLTGGRSMMSPIEIFMAPLTAKRIKLGSKGSVKGSSHLFERIVPEGGTFAEADDAPENKPQIELQDSPTEERVQNFHAFMIGKDDVTVEKPGSDISDFNNFATQKQETDDEYYN